jgi:predicted flavoprotein YhiN
MRLLYEASLSQGLSIGEIGPLELAALIKSVPVKVEATAPIDRAISAFGGVMFSELDADNMLVRRSGVFVAGEMLDWDAPTGGYLPQASIATGAATGRGALKWLSRAGRSA